MQNAESWGRISLVLQTAPPGMPIPPPATSFRGSGVWTRWAAPCARTPYASSPPLTTRE
jgi:hypothetical protein